MTLDHLFSYVPGALGAVPHPPRVGDVGLANRGLVALLMVDQVALLTLHQLVH